MKNFIVYLGIAEINTLYKEEFVFQNQKFTNIEEAKDFLFKLKDLYECIDNIKENK